MVEREKKRIKLNNKYQAKRENLLKQYQTTEDFTLKLEIHSKNQKFEKDPIQSGLRMTSGTYECSEVIEPTTERSLNDGMRESKS